MSTLTLELKDDHVVKLKNKALRLGLSLETYASKALGFLGESDSEGSVEYVDARTFERVLQASIDENDEAYRLLAQ